MARSVLSRRRPATPRKEPQQRQRWAGRLPRIVAQPVLASPLAPDEDPPPPFMLSAQDFAIAVKMNATGKTHAAIAKALGVSSPKTIQQLLKSCGELNTVPQAKLYLRASALQLAEDAAHASAVAARDGDGTVALELLDRLDVARRRDDSKSGNRVMVVIGQPTAAALPAGFSVDISSPDTAASS